MIDKQTDIRMKERSEQREEAPESLSREFQWAIRNELMDAAAEPCASVTHEELAKVMHRTLEYFWEQIITAVKKS